MTKAILDTILFLTRILVSLVPSRLCPSCQIAGALYNVSNYLIFFFFLILFTYLCFLHTSSDSESTWYHLYTLTETQQLPDLHFQPILSWWLWQKAKKMKVHENKETLGRVLRTDMLGTNIRYRTRHYYLMFNLEYARICQNTQNTETPFTELLFYQNQTKWACQKGCILLVISYAISTVILSNGLLLLSIRLWEMPRVSYSMDILKRYAFHSGYQINKQTKII